MCNRPELQVYKRLSAIIGLSICAFMLSLPLYAQTRMVAQQVTSPEAKMKKMCGAREVTSSTRGSKTKYSCTSKPKRAASTSSSSAGSMSIKAADTGGLRAEINCSYSESGGVTKWLGCTCKANDDGNCNAFITNCVEEGDDVGGNSGGASCSPPGG